MGFTSISEAQEKLLKSIEGQYELFSNTSTKILVFEEEKEQFETMSIDSDTDANENSDQGLIVDATAMKMVEPLYQQIAENKEKNASKPVVVGNNSCCSCSIM